MRSVFVRFLLLLPLCSCQTDPPVLNFTDYRSAFNNSIAEYFQRCGVLDSSRAPQLQHTSLLAVAPELEATINQEVGIGRVQLTTDCFSSLGTAACDISDAFAAIQDCITGGKEYLPQVGPGGLCRLQGECMGGYCDLGAVKRPCGTGNCGAYLPPGTQCGIGKGQCNPDQSTCGDDGVCHKRGGPGSSCASDAECDTSSFCHGDGQGHRTCAARKKNLATGSTCDPGQVPSSCKGGDRCLQQLPATTYACTTGKPTGASCFGTLDCAGSMVCVGADLVSMKAGACRPQGKIGDACNQDQGAVCQLTLYCSPASGTCKAAGDVGGACEGLPGGQSCLTGQCSALNGSGTCQDTSSDGGPCAADNDCKSGVCNAKTLACSSVCAPLR